MPGGDEPTQMGSVKVVLAENIPKYAGDGPTGVNVRQWFHALEALFLSDGISDDSKQLSIALANIDYEKGDARHIATMSDFNTYGDLKKTFVSYFEKINLTPTLDFTKIINCTWTSNMTFPMFATQLAAAAETFERSKLYTVNTGYEIAKATILTNVKRLFSTDTHCKLEKVAETAKCASHSALQKFLLETFRLTEHERKNEKVFAMNELAEEMGACYVGPPRRQVHFGREPESRSRSSWGYDRGSQSHDRHNQRLQGNQSPQRSFHRSVSPGANRGNGGPRPYSGRSDRQFNDRSPSYRREREASHSPGKDHRRSQSPERFYECWNCGEFHQGGASKCTVCLICGNSSHPTRECKNRKKNVQSRKVNMLVENQRDEYYESENFL